LEKTLEMSQELANFFPGYEHIADPLIDSSDYGMKAKLLRAIFADLREQLVPIVQTITEQAAIDNTCLHRGYPEAEQIAFSLGSQESGPFRGTQPPTHRGGGPHHRTPAAPDAAPSAGLAPGARLSEKRIENSNRRRWSRLPAAAVMALISTNSGFSSQGEL